MKKLGIKLLSVVMMLVLLFTLSSCGKYVNSYKAIGLVKMQTTNSFEISFYSLEGQMVFQLKDKDSGKEGNISYSVQVDEGEVSIYYDVFDTKQDLAHVSGGESISTTGGYIESGHTVYIIIVATQASNGRVTVSLNFPNISNNVG